MRYLHTMVRVKDIDQSLDFYCNKMGMVEVRRSEHTQGRFTLVFLSARDDVAAARAGAAPSWNSPTTGTRKPMARAGTSATSPTRSTTSTPPARA